MNAFTRINFFTLVLILVSYGELGWGRTCPSSITTEVYKTSPEIARNTCMTMYTSSPTDQASCMSDCARLHAGTGPGQTSTTLPGCDGAYSAYTSALTKTYEECRQVGSADIADCRSRAAMCASQNNPFGLGGSGLDSGFSANQFMSVLGASGMIPGMSSMCAGAGKEAKREQERLDDKITQLKRDINDLKEKAIKQDKELEEERAKVKEKMKEAEDEFNKKVFEYKTEEAKAAADLQKKVLEAQKKKRLSVEEQAVKKGKIADLRHKHQMAVLEFQDSNIMEQCRLLVAEEKKKRTAAKAKNIGQSGETKKFLTMFQKQCIQKAVKQRDIQLGDVVNQINTLNRGIAADEATAVEAQKEVAIYQEEYEKKKQATTENEQKLLESKNAKLNALAEKLAAFEKNVANQKQAYGEQAQAIEEQIQKVTLQKNNTSDIFTGAFSASNQTSSSIDRYYQSCCEGKTDTEKHFGCTGAEQDERTFRRARSSSTF